MSKLDIKATEQAINVLGTLWGRLNSAVEFPCSAAGHPGRGCCGRGDLSDPNTFCWTCKAQWHVARAEVELRTALQDARAVETVKAHGTVSKYRPIDHVR